MALVPPTHRCTDGDEFHRMGEQGVHGTLLKLDLDDAVSVEFGRFALHHLHGLLAGRIEGRGLIAQLDIFTG